jgi:WD40 repeat protein
MLLADSTRADSPVTQPAASKAKADQARVDFYGDPLPPGAVARIGSMQFRQYGLSFPVFSADGKCLIAASADRHIRTWDVASAKLLHTTKLEGKAGPGQCVDHSPDGRFFTCIDNGVLYFWDAQTGKELKRVPVALPRQSPYVHYLYFSPDGRMLAMGIDRTRVTLVDWKVGKQQQLMLPTQRPIDTHTDSTCHACFSLDGKLLATGGSWQDPLHVWDIASGKILHSFDAHASVSAFSPDGKYLAAASLANAGGGLRLYELASGKEVQHVPLPGNGTYRWIAFSPDGTIVVPLAAEAILLDRATGRELRRLAAWSNMVLFSPDGKLLLGAGGKRVRIWEVATGEELHDRPDSGGYPSIAYSPDGRWIVTASWEDHSLWNLATGQRVRNLQLERREGRIHHPSFAASGKTLLAGHQDGTVEFIDVANAKVLRTLSLNEPKRQYPNFRAFHLSLDGERIITLETLEQSNTSRASLQMCVWGAEGGKLIASDSFSPGAKFGWAPLGPKMAFLTAAAIVVADSRTGLSHPLVPGAWEGLVASADHKLLAGLEILKPTPGKQKPVERAIHVWEVATRKEIVRLPTGPVECLALVPDGRMIVTVNAACLQVWDLATGKERSRLIFPKEFLIYPGQAFVRGLCLSPDGRRATTPLLDGTILVWEVPSSEHPPAPRTNLDDQEVANLWTALAEQDASRAYAAIWKLTEAPGPALALLHKHLKPAVDENANRVPQLLRDLDSDQFRMRESAAKALAGMGSAIAPALRQALSANPSPEVRSRLQKLVANLARELTTPEILRNLRAIQILEQLGSPEAKKLLETLASGATAARETQEAKESLQRLAMKHAVLPSG